MSPLPLKPFVWNFEKHWNKSTQSVSYLTVENVILSSNYKEIMDIVTARRISRETICKQQLTNEIMVAVYSNYVQHQ